MKARLVLLLFGSLLAGAPHAGACEWPCISYLNCSGEQVPRVPTCAVADSCANVEGDGQTRARFLIPLARLESATESEGDLLSSETRVVDSITAHGGSGAPVSVVIELDVTLDRFEPEWPGGSAPEPWAWAHAELAVHGVGAQGYGGLGSGSPGHTISTRTLRFTRPIVPGGAPIIVEYVAATSASNGGRVTSSGVWRVTTTDPTVTLVHCRDIPVAARPTSWGALKSIYRGAP